MSDEEKKGPDIIEIAGQQGLMIETKVLFERIDKIIAFCRDELGLTPIEALVLLEMTSRDIQEAHDIQGFKITDTIEMPSRPKEDLN